MIEHQVDAKDKNSILVDLTAAQQSLWVVSGINQTASVAYNIPIVFEVVGDVDLVKLASAFKRVIKKHSILASTFVHHGKNLKRRIPSSISSVYIERIVSNNPLDEIKKLSTIPFDLEKGPLYKIYFVTDVANKKYLLINIHHIIIDGISCDILMKDLHEYYINMAASDEVYELNGCSPYDNYVEWQKNRTNSFEFKLLKDFWVNYLDDVHELWGFPTTFPRKNENTFQGKSISLSIDETFLMNLKELCVRAHCSQYVVLFAIYNVLIEQLTQDKHNLIGVPMAGRFRNEDEDAIGLFTNVIPVKVSVNKNEDFFQLIEDVKDNLFDAYEHSEVPFETIVSSVSPSRSLAHNPIFQSMFVHEEIKPGKYVIGDANLNLIKIDPINSKVDFSVLCITRETDGEIFFEYNTQIIGSESASLIANRFLSIANEIFLNPNKKISSIDGSSPKEIKRIFHYATGAKNKFSRELCVHQLFETAVSNFPNSIAISYEDCNLSYENLNSKSNALAKKLRENKRVINDQLVAICFDRSIEMVISIMAILKAGAAYVPIDPELPKERIESMLSQAGITVAITSHEYQERLNVTEKVVYRYVMSEEDDSVQNINCDEINLTSNNLAYMIFTSGSTGLPKGVLIEHSAIVNRLEWMRDEYEVDQHEVVLQKTPYSFDVSVWEFFLPLIVGAKLVIARPDGHKDAEYLVQLIKSYNVTLLHFVPSMFGVILSSQGLSECDSLKNVICSGEALSKDMVVDFKKLLPRACLHNLYGPTEAAVDVSYWDCSYNSEYTSNVPIGRPVQNTDLFVLNKNMLPTPLGAVGELYIGGVQLARGYVGDDILTNKKFINWTYKKGSAVKYQGRLYATGDLAKVLPDGSIDYLSRIDNQVKINGLRIELGDIENGLSRIEGIKRAVVLCVRSELGSPKLVAYITCLNELSISSIAERLRSIIPTYMVPKDYVLLEDFPVTKNGKLDRKKLEKMNASVISDNSEYVSPSCDFHFLMCSILSELTGLEIAKIGIRDNFFSLGCDSISLITMTSKLRRDKYNISLSDLYTYQNIEELTNVVERNNTNKLTYSNYPLDLTAAQKWFLNENFFDHSFKNVTYIFELDSLVNLDALTKSINFVVRKNPSLSYNFRLYENKWQVFDQPGFRTDYLDVIDYEKTKEIDFETFISDFINKSQREFSIGEGILAKFTLIKWSEKKYLHLQFHHLIADGPSVSILTRQIEEFYTFEASYENEIDSVNIGNYCNFMKKIASSSYANRYADYWRQPSSYPRNNIPKDFCGANQDNLVECGKYVAQSLEYVELKNALTKANSMQASVEKYTGRDILISSFVAALFNWSKLENLQLLVIDSGRIVPGMKMDIDVSDLVGWLSLTLPFNFSDSSENSSNLVYEILQKIPENVERSFAYELIKFYGEAEGIRSIESSSKIVFNYHGDISSLIESKSDLYRGDISELVIEHENKKNNRMCALYFDAYILNGFLHLSLHYNGNDYMPITMEKILVQTLKNINSIAIN